MAIPPEPRQQQALPAEAPFGQTLYRFLFFDWLFRDVSAARNLYERHAAREHNRRMSRYLPVYMRRWSVLAGFDFALGFLFERVLSATALSAVFFTGSCVTLTGIAVMTVTWLFLTYAKLS
ncbi:hypothetical protein [Massilia sp. IC2-476]|uniref:hypothetical protein n=1 Tax=Massilia sp. IC2-476 TaxID=2887199 RepID=UPI001D107E63|nr:hypothetical protein [Massilia sp. IC2-476]MCC2972959.1 hypothetical protein [Massilia sp. IC2-476]